MAETALITGAGSGLGYEFSLIAASQGINIVMVSRNREKLEEAAGLIRKKYNVEVTVIAADLSEADSPERIYREVREKGIRIDYLVNNAGFGKYGFFTHSDHEANTRMINLNIAALTRLTQLYGEEMAERKSGRILNIASTAAFQPGPLMSVYYATKAYVLSFSQAVAEELERHGVTVTALCPGPVATGFKKEANLSGSPLFEKRKNASASVVADFGWKAMKKGKRIAVHGFVNSLLALAVRFLPSRIVSASVFSISLKKGDSI